MKRLSRLAPGLFVVLWATGFVGARYAMPWSEPFTFLTLRFSFALLLFILLAFALGAKWSMGRGALNAMIAGFLMQGVYLGGVFWAIHRGMPAGLAALIAGLQPLITAILAGVFLGDRVLARQWAGIAIGFAGVMIVVLPSLRVGTGGVTVATLFACVIAVIGMSVGTIWQKRYGGSDLITGTAWQYLGGAVPMVAAALLFEDRHVVVNGEFVFALAWLVIVLSVGAILLLMLMIREGEVAKVASLFYLVPAVTAIMTWVLFDERLTPLQIGGMVVTCLGVALATGSRTASQSGTRARASR
ncbi:MAG: DMT family transporter [Hyphomicrobiales bacterium]|nr:DMT family transporter [Hyphomicrobiales bacterium]